MGFNPSKYIEYELIKDFATNVNDVRLQSLFLFIVTQTRTSKDVVVERSKITELGLEDADLNGMSKYFKIKLGKKGEVVFTWVKFSPFRKSPDGKTNLSTYLKLMDWPDLIAYFTVLPSKEDFRPSDLCDYFHFKILNGIGAKRWRPPAYNKCQRYAVSLLSLYGKELSITLIDILFNEYNSILGRPFEECYFSIGMLVNDNCSWILNKVLIIYERENRGNKRLNDLQKIPRKEWTPEQVREFFDILEKGV